jgi:WD40 repeat protein
MSGFASRCARVAVCVAAGVLAGCGAAAPTPDAPEPPGQPGAGRGAGVVPVKTLTLPGDDWTHSLGVSFDGKRVFGGVGDIEDKFQLWDVSAAQRVFAERSADTSATAISADGKTAAYPSPDRKIALIDLASGKELRRLERKSAGLASYVPGMRFSAKGDVLAINNRKLLIGFDTKTGDERFAWDNGDELFRLSGFFDGGQKIASSGPTGVVKVWDVATGRATTLSDAGPGDVTDLEVSPDGKFLAAAGWGQSIKVWDTATWKKVREITPWAKNYGSMVFIPNRNLLAYTSSDVNTVHLIDVVTGERKYTLSGHKSTVSAMAVTPDGKTLVTAGRGDRLINFWDLSRLP